MRRSLFHGRGSTDTTETVPAIARLVGENPSDAYWLPRSWTGIEFSSDAVTRDLRSPVWHEDDVRRRSTNSWSRLSCRVRKTSVQGV